jgi:hypothetical protein
MRCSHSSFGSILYTLNSWSMRLFFVYLLKHLDHQHIGALPATFFDSFASWRRHMKRTPRIIADCPVIDNPRLRKVCEAYNETTQLVTSWPWRKHLSGLGSFRLQSRKARFWAPHLLAICLDAAIRTAEVVMGAGLSCKGLVSSTPIVKPKHCPLLEKDFLHPPSFPFPLI